MNEMTITKDETHETHRYVRTIELTDGPREAVPEGHYSHQGKSFAVTRVSIKWNHGEAPDSADVQGLLLRKDGSVGSSSIGMRYNTEQKRFSMGYPTPGWLREIISSTHE